VGLGGFVGMLCVCGLAASVHIWMCADVLDGGLVIHVRHPPPLSRVAACGWGGRAPAPGNPSQSDDHCHRIHAPVRSRTVRTDLRHSMTHTHTVLIERSDSTRVQFNRLCYLFRWLIGWSCAPPPPGGPRGPGGGRSADPQRRRGDPNPGVGGESLVRRPFPPRNLPTSTPPAAGGRGPWGCSGGHPPPPQ